MVQGHASLDGFDNCNLHPDQCFCCFFGQKEGILWGKNVFLVESLIILLRKLTKYLIPQNGKRNPDPDVECKSQGVFCNFGYLLFFHFNKN
jgi:hypothetical protein